MQKTKIVCKTLWCVVAVCLLSGCWDKTELENKAYVIGLGIDPSVHKGMIRVTMLIANPEVGSMQGGGGSTEKPREIITFDSYDFLTAKSTANAIISRQISYELLKVVVVSEKFAKSSKFLTTIYDTVKDKEIRMDSYLVVCKEHASKYFLKNKPKMETRPHKYYQYMIHHGIDNGLIPDSTLLRFFDTLERGTDLPLVMYTTTEKQKNPPIKGEDEYVSGQLNATGEIDDTQFIGSAVFRNGEMFKTINGRETRLVNILDDTVDMKDILINIPDPFSDNAKQMALRITKTANNKVDMNVNGERLKIMITIPLQFEVLSNPSMADFTKNKKNREILKKQISNHIIQMEGGFLKKLKPN